VSENSSELDMFETGRRSADGDEIEKIRAETARHNAEAEKIKAETARLAAQDAAARRRMEEEELTKWEYTIEDVRNIQRMNQLGAQGWKLVGVSSSTVGKVSEGVLKRKQRPQQNQPYGVDFSYSR